MEIKESSWPIRRNQPKNCWFKRHRATGISISSNAARLTLLWYFCVGIIYGLTSNPGSRIFQFLKLFKIEWVISVIYIGNAISLCLYPLAGYLADNVVGRYKMIVRSLQILIITVVLTILPLIAFTVVAFTSNATNVVGYIGIIVTAIFLYFAMNVSFIGFNANVIQFGMEQLHDSPADHQSLFIYWYVWIYYLIQLLIAQPWNIMSRISYTVGIIMFVIAALPSLVIIVISLCVAYRKKNWFLVNPATVNPYKLVYKITRYARQHKVPIRRSAFTYCEEILDLAKTKYGGPYTTEEVENVKAFYGILKILLSLGPLFFCSYAVDVPLFWYINTYMVVLDNAQLAPNLIYHYVLDDNTLSSVIILVLIPVHIIIIRRLSWCPPMNMLKKIGLGIIFFIINLTCIAACVWYFVYKSSLVFDINSLHNINCNVNFVSFNSTNSDETLCAILYILSTLPRCLCGISNLLIYTALYEFICAQSPSSMKGLLIGLSFAVKGIYQALGAVFSITIFTTYIMVGRDMIYYGVNIALAVVVFIMFCYFSKQYKYRQKDEICDVYRYAEEYYSNNQTEENYD